MVGHIRCTENINLAQPISTRVIEFDRSIETGYFLIPIIVLS